MFVILCYTHVLAQYLDAFRVSRKCGQVQWRGPEVVGFRQVGAGVQQQPDQLGVSLVRGPVQRGVAVDVGQMVQGAHAQQETRRGRFAKHAGRHQRRETFEVRYVRVHTGLEKR